MMFRSKILRQGMAGVVAGALATALPLAAQAQSCAAGYYYASDGNCYPGSPPNYLPPTYDTAPPVSTPPVVTDGLLIGLGLLIGAAIESDHGDHHGRPEEHRPSPRRGEAERHDHYEQDHR
ncbi:MAG: hypothetical protein ACYC9J_14280 [Sulfuricaulis sp.]